MLGGIRLRLSFTPERTCFAYINKKYSSNKENECIQLLYKGKKVLLWVIFTHGVPDRQILCNPMFCRILGLEEGLEVFVSPYPEVKVLDELFIDTDSPEDQEILEHNAELLQLHILDQLRLVVANQKAVVWISVAMPIVFTPKRTGILMNQSRIIVKVDPFDTYKGLQQKPKDLPKDTKSDSKFNNIGLINETILKPYLNVPKRKALRAVPIDSDGKKNLIHPYIAFVHEDFIDSKLKDNNCILAIMEAVPLANQQTESDEDNDSVVNDALFPNLCVEIVAIDHVVFRSLSREVYNKHLPTILIPKSLNNIINIENGMKIIVKMIDSVVDQPEHIHIETYSNKIQNENEVIEKFKRCVVENTNSGKKFLINDGFLKQNSQICHGFFKFSLKPDSLKYTMLNSESFRQCTISAKCEGEEELSVHNPVNNSSDLNFNTLCRTMKVREDIVQKIILNLNFEIHREASFNGVSEIKSNVLITGLSGTGKSTLCQIIQKELTVWSHIIHCRSLKGRKDIPEVLNKALVMCQEHNPAVLICDDVDSLVPSNLEGMPPQDIAYYQRLALVIKHSFLSYTGVCVLMTSLELRSLHPTLKQCTGKPMFTAQFDIPELDKTERSELLSFLLNDKVRKEFLVEDDDVIKMASETAGHNVRDITDYLNKKIFKAVKRKKLMSDRPRLIEAVSQDKEMTDAFDIWGEVGGMVGVKKQLTESIFWPMMYPSLFPSQSCGLLLYGPPGTGKSFIGSSLARITNMNFICVKGPELLSKYIGQSEKAVRDIFDKADMKRPCILFFDEFDSLAPKRGHDSTGVTDRVVNQLLARLDGAEGGARGPVLVATARPDLLDPALLRAGRIHTHVYCGLPSDEDRKEVLRILSESVNVSEDVRLEDIARRTEGFSPADLKSLLVTAQLTRLEKQLDSNEGSVDNVQVCQEDIDAALLETKPSLSVEQRLYYDTIYKRFRGESLSPQERLTTNFQKQKVTLA